MNVDLDIAVDGCAMEEIESRELSGKWTFGRGLWWVEIEMSSWTTGWLVWVHVLVIGECAVINEIESKVVVETIGFEDVLFAWCRLDNG